MAACLLEGWFLDAGNVDHGAFHHSSTALVRASIEAHCIPEPHLASATTALPATRVQIQTSVLPFLQWQFVSRCLFAQRSKIHQRVPRLNLPACSTRSHRLFLQIINAHTNSVPPGACNARCRPTHVSGSYSCLGSLLSIYLTACGQLLVGLRGDKAIYRDGVKLCRTID